MQTLKQYTEANRLAWNEAMTYHQKANGEKWDELFGQPGYSVFNPKERDLLETVGVKGKRIIHLCCNNGVELLSLKNMGADRCLGVDISDTAVEEAQTRAKHLGLDVEYLRSDVFDLGSDLENAFDMVYISIGCLGWLPDIRRFMQLISDLLVEGGSLFIYEQHPFSEMLPGDHQPEVNARTLVEPYFKDEPYEDTDGIDYVGGTSYESKPQYWFVWTLSHILTAIIDAGLRLKHFSEHPEDISTMHQRTQALNAGIPLSYFLIASKED